jgi:hypothetical protein
MKGQGVQTAATNSCFKQLLITVAVPLVLNQFSKNWRDLIRVLKDEENGPNFRLLAQTV